MPNPWTPPSIPRHFSHIRTFFLMYGQKVADITAYETDLLNRVVDLVVPAEPGGTAASYIQTNFPATPRGLYTNISNIYGVNSGFTLTPSISDAWASYAAANGFNVEDAYLHKATPVSSSNRWPSEYLSSTLQRPVTNVSNANFRAFCIQYYPGLLVGSPWNAIFLDNGGTVWSTGQTPPSPVVEDISNWVRDYGTLVAAIAAQMSPSYLFSNTDSSPDAQVNVIGSGPPSGWPFRFDEEVYRPCSDFTGHFTGALTACATRQALASPQAYGILDMSWVGYPGGGANVAQNDPVMQMAALSYYHMMSDPTYTFFCAWGGDDPGGFWDNGHWWPAIEHDIGTPTEVANQNWAPNVADPSLAGATTFVTKRQFTKAVVFFKCKSRDPSFNIGTWNAGPTTHDISGISPGTFQQLNADGTLGPATTHVTLSNGTGAIMIPTSLPPPPPPGSVFERRKSGIFNPRYVWPNHRRRF